MGFLEILGNIVMPPSQIRCKFHSTAKINSKYLHWYEISKKQEFASLMYFIDFCALNIIQNLFSTFFILHISLKNHMARFTVGSICIC